MKEEVTNTRSDVLKKAEKTSAYVIPSVETFYITHLVVEAMSVGTATIRNKGI
jgi:hypothetical protein